MVRRLGEFNEDYLARAREIYLTRNLSIDDIADQSAELLGQSIERGRLRAYSIEGNWAVEKSKALGKSPQSDDVKTEVDTIRKIVYNQIVAESESGLLVKFDNPEQRKQVTEYLRKLELVFVDFQPGGVDAQLVNAYMGLLTKSKEIGLESRGQSAKTTRQQVLDEAKKAIEEVRGNRQ